MYQSIYLLVFGIFLFPFSIVSGQRYVDTVNIIEAYEVPVYDTSATGKQVVLDMAYASSVIRNAEAWTNISTDNIPYHIDLVYTKYPLDYDKWLSNYDKLLNARIKNILSLDTRFKNNSVTWNIVIQTNCKTADETKAMFHGVVIKYAPVGAVVERGSPPKPLPVEETVTTPQVASTPPILPAKITTPALVPKVPYEFSSASAAAITPRHIYGTDVSDIEDVKGILRGELVIEDSTILKILLRHPEWKNSLIVMDWTASMYQYGAQLLIWHRLNLEQNISQVSHFIFFNDGDEKLSRQKVPGNTGGIYKAMTNSLQEVIRVMHKTMVSGTGGDIQENDLEAVLKGMSMVKDFDDLILIADNTSIRDMSLLSQIKKPIHVIICDPQNNYVNPEYIKIAFETGGSLHTLTEDLTELAQLSQDNPITRATGKFDIRDGQLIRIYNNK